MARSFSTKAGTLAALHGQLHSARLLPQVHFTMSGSHQAHE